LKIIANKFANVEYVIYLWNRIITKNYEGEKQFSEIGRGG